MERERSLFPETQLIVERDKAREEYSLTYMKHSDLLTTLSPRDTRPLSMDIFNAINELREKLKELQDKVKVVSEEKRAFVRKCPQCEDGFLSTQWKCGLCECKVCKQCLDIKEDDHECKEENIQSAKIIESHTKPCPTCGVRVQKLVDARRCGARRARMRLTGRPAKKSIIQFTIRITTSMQSTIEIETGIFAWKMREIGRGIIRPF
jgi:hypothetical protein